MLERTQRRNDSNSWRGREGVWFSGRYCEVIVSLDSLKKNVITSGLESRLGNCLKKLDWSVDNEYTVHVCTCTCASAVVRLKEGTVESKVVVAS